MLISELVINLQNYFGDAWNVFDFIIVLGSFIDIVYSEVNVSIRCARLWSSTRGNIRDYIQRAEVKLSLNYFVILAAWIHHHFHQFLQVVSRNEIGQATEQRGGHPNTFMDVYQVFSGSALCRPSHYNALFHLRCDRHASKQRWSMEKHAFERT